MENDDLILIILFLLIVGVIIYLLLTREKCPEQPIVASSDVYKKFHTTKEKSETLPVFERHDNRVIVLAPKITNKIDLPTNFDARERWPGFITGVMDQGTCGSCWAFSSCSVFSDRIKIATNGKDMETHDHISQYHLAACMKCGSHNNNKVCSSVCSGHYMDEVLDYIKKTGAYSKLDISRNSPSNGTQYICFEPQNGQSAKKFQAKSSYRVNPYTLGELNTNQKRIDNEYAIMHEIYTHGPVTTTIKIFDPMAKDRVHQNFYFHTKGIYGADWEKGDPKETDGYHAISIIGWGEEMHKDKMTKYWLVRNSWGTEWGVNGYGKILRGENRIIVESDLWAMTY